MGQLVATAAVRGRSYAGLRRFEFGAETADIRTGCIGRPGECRIPSFGLGAVSSRILNSHFAVDADFLMTPAASQGATNVDGGRASEILGGIRAETRARHYGYFLTAKAGSFEWSRVITGVTTDPHGMIRLQEGPAVHFVSEVGAGFEYSPSSRVHIRGSVTDLIYRYSGQSWLNYLQPALGTYYGFGNPLAWRPPVYDVGRAHPFFDWGNGVLVTGALLANTADAITTQRWIAEGYEEGDPFARPLVKYGWSGQIVAMGLETTLEVLGMYGLHRLGRHWIERMVPAGIATAHGVFAYGNAEDPQHTPAPGSRE